MRVDNFFGARREGEGGRKRETERARVGERGKGSKKQISLIFCDLELILIANLTRGRATEGIFLGNILLEEINAFLVV